MRTPRSTSQPMTPNANVRPWGSDGRGGIQTLVGKIPPSVAIVACIAAAWPARADGLYAGPTDRVALDVPKDAVITAVGALGALVPLALTSQLASTSCRWCDGPIGTSANPVDDWFHQHLTASIFSRSTANTLSSVVAYGLMPGIALTTTVMATGPHATPGAGLRNAVIVAESVAVAQALVEVVKFSVARQRPYVHYGHLAPPGAASDFPAVSSDDNLSFPSGHTSLAAAAGTSAAMLATLEESPAAPWLWGATGVLTVATGTLRMASESHYFTDVVAGAVIGAGCGVLLPLLHRRGSMLDGSTIPAVSAGSGGAAFMLSGAF
jgi:membrane-associated phospholipid phosphatase